MAAMSESQPSSAHLAIKAEIIAVVFPKMSSAAIFSQLKDNHFEVGTTICSIYNHHNGPMISQIVHRFVWTDGMIDTLIDTPDFNNESLLFARDSKNTAQKAMLKSEKKKLKFWTEEIKAVSTELKEEKFDDLLQWIDKVLTDTVLMKEDCPYASTIAYIYTLNTPSLFHQLNKNIITAANSKPKAYRLYRFATALSLSIDDLSEYDDGPYRDTTYRVGKLSLDEIKRYRTNANKYIFYPGFVSATTDIDIAMDFVDNNDCNVVFKILVPKQCTDKCYAVNIADLSKQPRLKEVVFPSHSHFKIISAQYEEWPYPNRKYWIIRLAYTTENSINQCQTITDTNVCPVFHGTRFTKQQQSCSHLQTVDIHFPKHQFREEKSAEMDNNRNDTSMHKSIKIVVIGDTHTNHRRPQLSIPDGDILIHTGDFTHELKQSSSNGHIHPDYADFNEWLSELPHKYKIVIGGNHEKSLDWMSRMSKNDIQTKVLTNAIYLQDSSVNLFGLSIYGTPWTNSPTQAFDATKKLALKWKLIPDNSDVLVTHMAPFGIFDRAYREFHNFTDVCTECDTIHQKFDHWGCKHLLNTVRQRVKPKLHLFGHIHDDIGSRLIDDTLFVNGACLNFDKPHVIQCIFDL